MKLSFGNMTVELSIFNLEQESIKQASVNMTQDKPIDIRKDKVDLEPCILPNHEYSIWNLKNGQLMARKGIGQPMDNERSG